MNLKHVKLNSGDDIICTIENHKTFFRIHNPILIYIDPELGMMAKNWLALSASTYVDIMANKIMFSTDASETAITYYQEFVNYVSSKSTDLEDEVEQTLSDMLEAKTSTKH